ncbi:MAG: hypothetical protein JW706_05155 [Opitutales bacterium]|nr:hypothetical protein [Opitutales bacterium]
MKTLTIVFLGVSILLSGCASMSDSSTTRAQGAGFGAAIGAGLGAIVGAATGDTEKGALIGAAVGGVAGLAYGDHVAKKKEKYASQEDYLNACIAEADKRYRATKVYNDKIRTEIANLETQLQEAETLASGQQDNAAQLSALRDHLAKNLKQSEQMMTQVTDEITIQREVLANESNSGAADRIDALNQEIAKLEEQKAQLEENTRQLAALNNRASA